ncbi:MAG: hypothetical protein RR623_08270 [Bacilli bacterium]
MTNKELRNNIISDLKLIGIEKKEYHLSVKNSLYDIAVHLIIKKPNINIKDVEKSIGKYEVIDYCNITNEILSGGNVYVFIDYDYNVFDCVIDDYKKMAIKSIAEVNKLELNYGYRILSKNDITLTIFKTLNNYTLCLNDLKSCKQTHKIYGDIDQLSINIYKALSFGFID